MKPRDSVRYDLERALEKKGCALCHLEYKAVKRSLDSILYESVNDPDIREETRAALGFCNRHAWQMRHLGGNALGMAFLQRSALDQWQKQLSQARGPNRRTRLENYRAEVAAANQAKARCLACQQQAEVEARYIETFLQALAEAEFKQLLHDSGGLCRVHFSQACRAARNVETLNALVEIQAEINRRLMAELDEFIRKSDYRFIAEGFGPEGDSWVRAIERLSGAEDALC
jgi:Family of unknown function (DUF6062)